MRDAETYEIVPHPEGWAVKHEGELSQAYATKQAAFEAATTLAEALIAEGCAIEVRVPAEGPPQGG